MKKIAVIFLFVFISLTASAQWTFGPKVAFNASGFSEDMHFNPGFDLGLFVRSGGKFYFQPEVYYSLYSTNFKDAIEEIKDRYDNLKVINHCINVPLLVGYDIVHNTNFKFRVFVGPRFGFLVNSETDQDIKNLFGVMNYGAEAGVGLDAWRFTFDIKYVYSASKSKAEEVNSWNQHVISLGVGFKIL